MAKMPILIAPKRYGLLAIHRSRQSRLPGSKSGNVRQKDSDQQSNRLVRPLLLRQRNAWLHHREDHTMRPS